MTHQPAQLLLADTIRLPCAQVHERTLEISASATDAEILELTHRLITVAGFAHWALAAALGELLMRKTAAIGADAAESWLNQFCVTAGLKPKLRRELLAVHTFYPPAQRQHDLTYEHYRDAMLIASDGRPSALPRALATLAIAHDNNWTVSELRRHARAAAATEQTSATYTDATDFDAPTFEDFRAVETFARFVHAELPRLSAWTHERAAIVRDELCEVREFLDRLDGIAALRRNT